MLNHNLIKPLAICLCFLIFTGCGVTKKSTSDKGSPLPQSGLSALSVQGNRIVNTTGTPIILRGINAIDPLKHSRDITNWQGAGAFAEPYFAAMASWKANVVRLPVHPEAWRVSPAAESLAVLDQAIGWAKKHQMYTIIDLHSIGLIHRNEYEITTYNNYTTSLNEVIAYWQTIAAHYKNEPAVAAYEIFNEPTNLSFPTQMSDWASWKNDAETIISAIRAIDPQKIIIVGGLQWAYDLSPVAANPISDTNIVYATHVYPGSNYNRSWDEAFGDLSSIYPVIATEIGYTPGSNAEPYGENRYPLYTNLLKNYFLSKNISWTAWCFSTVWEPQLITDQTLYTPSAAGQYFKDWLASY
jgi:aryl-phospho-beta-D-glucosidase BglC (GH1 family)